MNIFKRLSHYLLNKRDQEAIVYKSVDGITTRLTASMFSSRKEFLIWKQWSDDDYAEIERSDRQFYDHTVPLGDYDGATPSTEESVLRKFDKPMLRLNRKNLTALLLSYLTPSQRRRFLLYHVRGLSQKEIATIEGVSQQKISSSLSSVRKLLGKPVCKHIVNKLKSMV